MSQPPVISMTIDSPDIQEQTGRYFRSALLQSAAHVDTMMMWLMAAEWLGMMAAAAVFSPRAWAGGQSVIHPHLLAAILAGPTFILPVIAIAMLYPARAFTRHAIAVAQMLVSALLIDCTGGRIETHFHIFGSLAFLAAYRDWRVLLTASAVTAADHFFRGIWWPQSVYGVLAVSPWRWVEHTWWVVFEDFFLLISMRSSLRDSRLIAHGNARLYDNASHDVLTGLANRRLLQERFETCCEAGEKAWGALLFIDLDRFKHANDTLGHTVGDQLLSRVSDRFAQVVGSAHTLARVGGDEFVVLLGGASATEATAFAQRLLRSMNEPFHINEHDLLLSASVGISLFPDHGTTLLSLQERADHAMYAAKARGRNQCVLFSLDVARSEQTARELFTDLPDALGRGEFSLVFQPLVRKQGNLVGFEALLRWHHPDHGLISPGEFIPLAEKSGLIVELGDWVLREACRICSTWQKPFQSPIGVAVNVSPLQFDQPDYPDLVFAALSRADIEPSLLTLELTEGILVRDPVRARSHLARIRLAGIRVALDDFGTGYSSLSYLSELPADLIKLDRSFVNRDSPGSAALIESVIALAHRLGFEVLAEGIETSTQKDHLVSLMCDQMQGYYFSPPISQKAVSELLDARSLQVTDSIAPDAAWAVPPEPECLIARQQPCPG